MNITPINNNNKYKQSFGVTGLKFLNDQTIDKFAMTFPSLDEFGDFKKFLTNNAPTSGDDIDLLISIDDAIRLSEDKNTTNVANRILATVSLPYPASQEDYKRGVKILLTKISGIREYTSGIKQNLLQGIKLK